MTSGEPVATAGTERATTDSIDRWLDVLARLLRVSHRQRDAIRDEIEEHLRERVHELMIGGADEMEAVRCAIEELGEVADLARRFSRAAHIRTRRLAMNLGLIGFGAVSVATVTMFVHTPGADPDVAVMSLTPPGGGTTEETVLDQRTIEAAFSGESLETVLRFTAEVAELDLVLHRRSLEDGGVMLEEEVDLSMSHSRSLTQVLTMVSQQMSTPFDWRVSDGVLEVATRETFDERSVVLASFDVQDVLYLVNESCNDMDMASDRLEGLITEYIEPEAWDVNGGMLGQISIVGGKMFVKAPGRFHEPIKWILGELEENVAQAQGRSSAPGVGPNTGADITAHESRLTGVNASLDIPPTTNRGGAMGSGGRATEPAALDDGGSMGSGGRVTEPAAIDEGGSMGSGGRGAEPARSRDR